MPTVFDAAQYILQKQGEMTAMKLQKLIYYAQAWSLVWDETPLFDEPIQAWANGPVCPPLYFTHKGQFKIAKLETGNAEVFNENQIATMDAILEVYAKMSSQQLSDLTHAEGPWKNARIGLSDGDRGEKVISHLSMHEYYSGL
ncbi:MAG: DUF4065 domain-containing protein [Chloracidobacterium sp.]|nr:DUF4065 domain-containing protein [Chloracidobacterium sp.]